MKNVKVFFVALALSAFVFGACGEKCITCTTTVAGVATDTEFCGNKEERDAFEVSSELGASLVPGATVSCE
ncbi:MAG: hypothetical protein AB8F95_12845 [Bacteroidia bacterium]